MLNYFYGDSIESFLEKTPEQVIGEISNADTFNTNQNSRQTWHYQIHFLKSTLVGIEGRIFFEFSIPRMGKRIDCLLLVKNVVFVVEFKVGESTFLSHNIEQTYDYALDLKNFHEPSHHAAVVPILLATQAPDTLFNIEKTSHDDNLIKPILVNSNNFRNAIENVLTFFRNVSLGSLDLYEKGRYSPTPTIIEAAVNLYNNHSVEAITRNDAEAINLSKTTEYITGVIDRAKRNNSKIICFVTGVPGAGKTLVGLKIATKHLDNSKGDSSVFLSGNGPLVAILQEALTRDQVMREKLKGNKITKSAARQGVKAFIQIIHHYRDSYLSDIKAPYDHVAIFDEAQRAWTKAQTIDFMKRKKNQPDFNFSEPEFLISCLNRHQDWAVIICLVGGGQEINTGEAGITEWLSGIEHTYPEWEVAISPNLVDSEYNAVSAIDRLKKQNGRKIEFRSELHLAVSMRSFRAETVSKFVKQLLDLDSAAAKETFRTISENYPIVVTRKIERAKVWLREKARGSERYGIVVSSQAYRLKPLAINVQSPIDPVHWFLNDRNDVRSSYYLEDVATEFQVQGLELDWACVTWDGDLRYSSSEWKTFSFVGTKWQNINKTERKIYLKNAYRVLLTRARQGMVIVVPEGDMTDPTRHPDFYDDTFRFLTSLGIPPLSN